MYCRLAIVKQHLKEALQKMAFMGKLTKSRYSGYEITVYRSGYGEWPVVSRLWGQVLVMLSSHCEKPMLKRLKI